MNSRLTTEVMTTFNNTTAFSSAIDITSFNGAAIAVLVTGTSGAGNMKLQASLNPGDDTAWFDVPATLGGATVSQTITIAAQHYLNTGNIAFYPSVRVSITSTNTNPIVCTVKAMGKG